MNTHGNIIFKNIFTFVLVSLLLSACDIREGNVLVTSTPTDIPISISLTEISPTSDSSENDNQPEETQTPAVTNTPDILSISVYHMGNLSGEGAEYVSPWISSFSDILMVTNQNGGVAGILLEENFKDTAGEIEVAVETYHAWVEENPNIPFILVYENEIVEALLPLAQEDQIVIISPVVSNSNANTPPEYFYGFGVSYEHQFEHFLSFMAENWEMIKPHDAFDEVYLAYFAWEGDEEFQGLTDESREYAASLGIRVERIDYIYKSPTESLSNQVMRAQWAAGNYIYGNFHSHGAAVLMNDIYRLGLQLVFGVGMPYQALDLNTYGYLGYQGFLNKVHAPFPIKWWSDEDSIAVQQASTLIDQQGGSHLLQENQARLIVTGIVQVMQRAFEQAVENEEINQINGEIFNQILSTLSSNDIENPLFHFDFAINSAEFSQLQIRKVTDQFIFDVVEEFSLLNLDN